MNQKIDNSGDTIAAILGGLIALSTIGGFTIIYLVYQGIKFLFS